MRRNLARHFYACVPFLCAAWTTDVSAQDYGQMLQYHLQQDANLTAQMQQMQSNIVNQNMNNPQVRQMYQQHLAQGGQMSLEQFAYAYAATAGFTPQGLQTFQANERNIQARDQAALQAYRQNQMQNAEVYRQMHERNAAIAHHRGNLLSGTTDFYDPRTGQQYNLPHTWQPNTVYTNPDTGQGFYANEQGSYFADDDGDGWFGSLEEVE